MGIKPFKIKRYSNYIVRKDEKSIKEIGKDEFLKQESIDCKAIILVFVVPMFSLFLSLFFGISFVLNPPDIVFFVFGIVFLSLSVPIFVLFILIIVLPFFIRRSKYYKNELQLLLQEKELAPQEEVSELEVDNSEGMQDVVEKTEEEIRSKER